MNVSIPQGDNSPLYPSLEIERDKAKSYTLSDFVTRSFMLQIGAAFISFGSHGFICSCDIFQLANTCCHLMALESLVPSFPSLNLHDLAEGFRGSDR